MSLLSCPGAPGWIIGLAPQRPAQKTLRQQTTYLESIRRNLQKLRSSQLIPYNRLSALIRLYIVLVPQLLPIAIRMGPQVQTRAPSLGRMRFLNAHFSRTRGARIKGTALARAGEPMRAFNTGGIGGSGWLEPPTSPLSGVRSNQLSYRPKQKKAVSIWGL